MTHKLSSACILQMEKWARVDQTPTEPKRDDSRAQCNAASPTQTHTYSLALVTLLEPRLTISSSLSSFATHWPAHNGHRGRAAAFRTCSRSSPWRWTPQPSTYFYRSSCSQDQASCRPFHVLVRYLPYIKAYNIDLLIIYIFEILFK